MMKDRLIYVNGIKALKHSEYIYAIERAKQRTSIKDSFYL